MLCCGVLCCAAVWHAQVCSKLAMRPTEGSSKDVSLQLGRLVSAVIQLRDVLRSLPVMADSMAWVDSPLLKVWRGAHKHSRHLQQCQLQPCRATVAPAVAKLLSATLQPLCVSRHSLNWQLQDDVLTLSV
jgi:hypothetical protein